MATEQWVAWDTRIDPLQRPLFLAEDGSKGFIDTARRFDDYVEAKHAAGFGYQVVTLQTGLDDDRYWQEEQIEVEIFSQQDTIDIFLLDHHAETKLEISFGRYRDGVRLDSVCRYTLLNGVWSHGYYLSRYTGIGQALALMFSASQVAGAIMEKEGIYPRNSSRRSQIWEALGRLEEEV